MKIAEVTFMGSVADPNANLPVEPGFPQFAFSGRSNVGKSSLINVLLQRTRKRIAKVSATPGKTQLLNFYQVNGRFYLVDLPGFGYAKVPLKVKDQWKHLVEGYLARDDGPAAAVHLVDIRRDPTPEDLQMLDYLAARGTPTLVALTKVDKFSGSRAKERVNRLIKELQLDPEQVIPFSALTGEGRELLLDALESFLEETAGGETAEPGEIAEP